ncbi:MAG: fibrillin [Bacteroidota bacterium]|nr:fibrillin [Bacteroidota bacterium]
MRLPVVLLLLICLLVSSCNSCKNKNCLNGAQCVEGKCQCANQYAGVDCEINLCDSVDCHNGGNCFNGTCACASGFEGSRCDSIISYKFEGSYSCFDSCSSATTNIDITAYGAVSEHEILINTIRGEDPLCSVTGYFMTIPNQTLLNGDIVSGSGQLSLDRKVFSITMTIDPYGAAAPYNCGYRLTRL